jgi:arylsulfatase A-like enzyme/Tfp pilus assembly protein PilF
MLRKFVVCVTVAAVVGSLAFWLWPRPKTNLLLITLDTTRADHLGCYGYAGAKTPVLDELAASGVLCERAYTVAPLTLPAHASLFTGLYPAEHGVRSNGRGRLDDSIPTLAEVLRRKGYDTAAFVASFVLDARFGLARGFKKYDDDIGGESADGDSAHRERDAASVVDAALAWLQEKRDRPFFCWVHLYDPHAPYLTHADEFGDEFADRPYDAEIASVDSAVGRLVDFLKTRGLDSRTLVVIVGDHGEGLREHQEPRHGLTLYNTILHVPLIFRHSGQLAPGRRVSGEVSLADVSPTLLELVGQSDPRTTSGKSVAALLRGGDGPPSLCYAATDEPFLYNGWSPLRSLTENSWKYIRTARPELYNLATDPRELRNLAESEPDRLKEMEARLSEFEGRLENRAEGRVVLRPHERRALESLGYLGGTKSGALAPIRPSLPDIKDMLPFEVVIDDASDMISRENYAAAADRLSDVVGKIAGYSKAHCFLATALRRQSKFDEAATVLRSLLEARPDAVEGHYNLGLTLLEQGRKDEAVVEFERTLELDPDYADAQYELAVIAIRSGRTDEALSRFDAVLDIDHCHGAACTERGTLLAAMGRFDEALADLRQAVKYSPNSPTAHHNLGIVLSGVGRSDEALTHLQRAAALNPSRPEFRYALGSLLLELHKYADAARELGEALKLNPDDKAARDRLERAERALDKPGGDSGSR